MSVLLNIFSAVGMAVAILFLLCLGLLLLACFVGIILYFIKLIFYWRD